MYTDILKSQLITLYINYIRYVPLDMYTDRHSQKSAHNTNPRTLLVRVCMCKCICMYVCKRSYKAQNWPKKKAQMFLPPAPGGDPRTPAPPNQHLPPGQSPGALGLVKPAQARACYTNYIRYVPRAARSAWKSSKILCVSIRCLSCKRRWLKSLISFGAFIPVKIATSSP